MVLSASQERSCLESLPRFHGNRKPWSPRRRFGALPAIAAVISLLLTSSGWAGEAFFSGVGDLDGGDVTSIANAVSPDGTVVVGTSSARREVEIVPGYVEDLGRVAAFRWTRSEGISEIVGGKRARAASNLGHVVGETEERHVFRWSESDGFEDLGDMGGEMAVRDVSEDGSVIVGGSLAASGDIEAYRWSDVDGLLHLGALPHTNPLSSATAVSADGSVIVGHGRGGSFRWTAATGLLPIDGLPAGADVLGISADGTAVVGTSPSDDMAFLWSETDGVAYLEAIIAHAASADGRIVVGGSEWANPGTADAFVWDAVNGRRDLKALLEGYGLDLSGWTLKAALDVSDDGRTLVGRGIDPSGNHQGWVAVLPPQCDDGFDNDGDAQVDLDDPQCDSLWWNDESNRFAACGIGWELALALPPLLALRRWRRRGVSA